MSIIVDMWSESEYDDYTFAFPIDPLDALESKMSLHYRLKIK